MHVLCPRCIGDLSIVKRAANDRDGFTMDVIYRKPGDRYFIFYSNYIYIYIYYIRYSFCIDLIFYDAVRKTNQEKKNEKRKGTTIDV